MGFTGFYWVLTRLNWVFLRFTGLYCVLTRLNWVFQSFTGFYWVLAGFPGFDGFDLMYELGEGLFGCTSACHLVPAASTGPLAFEKQMQRAVAVDVDVDVVASASTRTRRPSIPFH